MTEKIEPVIRTQNLRNVENPSTLANRASSLEENKGEDSEIQDNFISIFNCGVNIRPNTPAEYLNQQVVNRGKSNNSAINRQIGDNAD